MAFLYDQQHTLSTKNLRYITEIIYSDYPRFTDCQFVMTEAYATTKENSRFIYKIREVRYASLEFSHSRIMSSTEHVTVFTLRASNKTFA